MHCYSTVKTSVLRKGALDKLERAEKDFWGKLKMKSVAVIAVLAAAVATLGAEVTGTV